MIDRKFIPENTAVGIVDFDNILAEHFELNNTNGLTVVLSSLISKSIESVEVDYCLIRLYGGWYSNQILTRKASIVLQTLGTQKFFPIIKNGKVIAGEIEIVSSMNHLNNLLWGDTYIRRKGIPSLTIDTQTLDEHCNQEKDSCPARLLKKFSKRKSKQCPVTGCAVINNQAFIISEQKMVDTIMATDIIDYSTENNISHLLVFSDDTDLLPPIMRAHVNNNNPVSLYIVNERLSERFTHLQKDYGLEINSIELL